MLPSVNKSPHLNQRNMQIKHHLQAKTVLNKYVGGSGCEGITGTGLFHWRKCYYGLWTGIFIRSDSLKLKCLNDGFVSEAQASCFTRFQSIDWSCMVQLVDYCDVFISCLESHSDGTHSLQRIDWWASVVMLNFSKCVLVNKQTHLHLGWSEGEYIFGKFSFWGEQFL